MIMAETIPDFGYLVAQHARTPTNEAASELRIVHPGEDQETATSLASSSTGRDQAATLTSI